MSHRPCECGCVRRVRRSLPSVRRRWAGISVSRADVGRRDVAAQEDAAFPALRARRRRGARRPRDRYAVGTYYGHGSWIALVLFFGLIAMRMLSTQRRRRGRTGAPQTSSFTDPPTPRRAPSDGAAGADAGAFSGQATFSGIAPCWLTDPTGRHEQRYWSGSEWTEHVLDGGVPGIDPPPGNAGREPSS